MKLKYIILFLTCPQIRWQYGDYVYSFWLWHRRSGEWINTLFNCSWTLYDGYYEENWGEKYDPNKKGTWCFWTKEQSIGLGVNGKGG